MSENTITSEVVETFYIANIRQDNISKEGHRHQYIIFAELRSCRTKQVVIAATLLYIVKEIERRKLTLGITITLNG